MSPEAQRLAIAEACGWTLEQAEDREHVVRDADRKRRWADYDPSTTWRSCLYVLPNYLNDLNAMHEAEKTLDERQSKLYVALLIGRVRGQTGAMKSMAVHSTAAQRAEAFLRTIGKWEA